MFIRTNAVFYLSGGFASAITLFPFVFIGKNTRLTQRLVVHERIHLYQQLELLVIPFYLWYLVEFAYRLIQFGNKQAAYVNISFEREAYRNDRVKGYLGRRKLWQWRHYL